MHKSQEKIAFQGVSTFPGFKVLFIPSLDNPLCVKHCLYILDGILLFVFSILMVLIDGVAMVSLLGPTFAKMFVRFFGVYVLKLFRHQTRRRRRCCGVIMCWGGKCVCEGEEKICYYCNYFFFWSKSPPYLWG